MEDINNVEDRKAWESYTGNEIGADNAMFSSETVDLTNKHKNTDEGDVQNEDNNVYVSPSWIKYKLYDQSPWGREKLSRNDENDKLKDAQSVNNHFSWGRETWLWAYLQKGDWKHTRKDLRPTSLLTSRGYNPRMQTFSSWIEEDKGKELKNIYENILSNLRGAFTSIPEDLTNKHVKIIYKEESWEDKEVNLWDRWIVVQGGDRDYSVRYDFPRGSGDWAYFERKHNGGIVGSYSVKEWFFDCINKFINNKDKCEIIVVDR